MNLEASEESVVSGVGLRRPVASGVVWPKGCYKDSKEVKVFWDQAGRHIFSEFALLMLAVVSVFFVQDLL